MDDSCGKCDKSFGRNDTTVVPCSGFCKKRFHRACCEGQITEYDVKMIKANYHIRYWCPECVNVLASQRLGLEAIMTAFEGKFKDLCMQVDDLKNIIASNKSSASSEKVKSRNKDNAKEKAKAKSNRANTENNNNIDVLAAEISALKTAVNSYAFISDNGNNNNNCNGALDLVAFSPSPIPRRSQSAVLPLNSSRPGSVVQTANNTSSLTTTTTAPAAPIPPSFASVASSPSATTSERARDKSATANTNTNAFENNSAAANTNNARKVVVGTRTSCELDVAARLEWFHVGSFKPSVETTDIATYIAKHTCIKENSISCYKLIKKDVAVETVSKVNFKIGVPSSDRAKIMDSGLWPSNVKIRPFEFFQKFVSTEGGQ
ncbi:uncharacterized protein [Eurosta solidaginis]|uniref:uncharacterized protein n=1 Tax=Eurosta solidaginis TaxID=178769 RepID=UPI003530E7F0